jgi:ABC-type multidrug transport system permease subunit
MYKLLEIIKKNLRLLVRSKSSALIVLFGPLFLILLISMAFNTTSLYDIKIGTYSGAYSELSDSIINKLNNDEFSVIKIDSKDGCINSIKSNDLHVCAIFPDNLDISTEASIEFYVDKSRINVVYIIINSISTKISTRSTELSTALTSTLLESINNADTKINEMSGTVTQISVDLKEIKSTINSVQSSLTSLNVTANITSLENKTEELNLTGEPGDLINSYRNLVKSLMSKLTSVQSSASELGNISLKLETQITDVNDISDEFSEISNDFNSIEVKEVSKIVSPISTEIKPISSESTHFDYTFPTLLVIVLLFSGLLVSSTTIIEEKSSKAFFRNFITPTPNSLFVLGNYLSNLLIVLSQIFIIFLALYIFTEAAIPNDIITNLLIIILLTASVFILLGMLIGYLFKSEETANLSVISLACILLFFSNTILPLETLPVAIRSIAGYNPFILGVESLKEILLFKAPLTAITTSFYILLIYFAVLIILIHLVRALSKRRYIQ